MKNKPNENDIVEAFLFVVKSDEELRKKIFDSQEIPPIINDTVISISSLDFIDLLIKMENQLNSNFAEKCIPESRMTIQQLFERIKTIA